LRSQYFASPIVRVHSLLVKDVGQFAVSEIEQEPHSRGEVSIMSTETAADREALDYWGVDDVDQPIGIVPFPCGRYVCPNHEDGSDEAMPACEPSVA
jgi:hypothetical protein